MERVWLIKYTVVRIHLPTKENRTLDWKYNEWATFNGC